MDSGLCVCGVLLRLLTSLQRAPALLDTYTLGLLAKFLPTDPASRKSEVSHAGCISDRFG